MFIPCLHDPLPVSGDDFPNGVQLFCCETLIFCQRHRLDPEFADHPFPLNMDVHSLVTVEAVEEEPVWARNIADRWHIDCPNEL
jgi:hypothetical protein